MTKKGGRVQTGVYLDADLLERLRKAARDNGMTISSVVERSVRQYLDGEGSTELPPELIAAIEKWYKDNEIRLR